MKSRLFLCVDGQNVTGPFGLDELRLAVARHEVSKATLACEEGTEAWQPLGELRPETFTRAEKKASPKQKALLAYLGYPSPEIATSAEATAWLDAFIADERNEERLEQWSVDRLTLHPDLYADEVAAAQEDAEWNEYEAELEREAGGGIPLIPRSVAALSPNSQQVREENRGHEKRVKRLSAVFIGTAILGITIMGSVILNMPDDKGKWLMLGVVVGFNAVSFAAGVGLFMLKSWARSVAIVLSLMGLIAFPIGTILYGICLAMLLQRGSRYVTSREYAEIVAATK